MAGDKRKSTGVRASNKSTRKSGKKRSLARSGSTPDIHCMRIPAGTEELLLPTTVMEEVIEFQQPEIMEGTPPWLLGEVEWENRQVPVFSFSALVNGSDVESPDSRSRIMILKSLTEEGRVPYLALYLTDLPKPVIISEGQLEETGDDRKSLGVFRSARLDNDDMVIPDLDRLTHLVTHAAFGALPITQLEEGRA